MTIQNQVSTAVVSAAEASLGVAASTTAADAKIIRRVTASLNLGKDVYTSNEARTDQQVADARHGTRRGAGSVEGEMVNAAYDDWTEALLRGTWTAGVTAATADYTTVAGNVVAPGFDGTPQGPGSTGTFVWAAGDPVAKGFRKGDVVVPTGTQNDSLPFRIIGFSGASNRTITVTPAPVPFTAFAISAFVVKGKKLTNGIQRRSFTIEQLYPEIDVSELFVGMRVSAGTFRLPPNGMASVGYSFMGTNGRLLDGAASPFYTAPTPAGNARCFAGPNGSLRFGYGEQGVVTGLELSVDNQCTGDPVVGTNFVPEIFYGTQQVRGNLSFFLQDASLLRVFYDELEVDLSCVVTTAGVIPDFTAFNMQRIKTMGVTKSIGAQGGVVVQSPFQALLANPATGVDGATISIQRSNT